MAVRGQDIASVIKKQIEGFGTDLGMVDVGTVIVVGDGIARVHGLSGVAYNELVEFEGGVAGIALNLEEDSVGIVILGDPLGIKEGTEVRGTGRVMQVPVGEQLLGRVVDGIGTPIDGKGPVETNDTREVEIVAPNVAIRKSVDTPVQTGIKAIDAMIPVGRGQRELIIGDRTTGKTAICVDAIINQKGQGVVCVYVAIGQKASTVANVVEALRSEGAMDYTTVVLASSADPAPLQYIAPYAGCAMAEYYMYQHGQDTLCVYDDLSKQAQAYRQLSLLMRRPPGREAYPGDIFYCHSRLLERSVKVAEDWVIVPEGTDPATVTREQAADGNLYRGPLDRERAEEEELSKHAGHTLAKIPSSGGSLTALPIIETLEGEVSAYIPTNVISITDGQIYLVPDLFFSGIRPAVDVGISVSRVGGKAQNSAMKKVSGGLRLDLAAFRELEAFAQLGTELDRATQSQLDRGYRMVELLKQPQYQPMHVADQVLSIFAGTRGHLDSVPATQVAQWETEFLRFMREQKNEVRERLVESQMT